MLFCICRINDTSDWLCKLISCNFYKFRWNRIAAHCLNDVYIFCYFLFFVWAITNMQPSLAKMSILQLWLTWFYIVTFSAKDIIMELLMIHIFDSRSTHCVKSAKIRSFFWSLFSCIRTECGDLRTKSPYSIQIQENTDQKKLRIWTLFT